MSRQRWIDEGLRVLADEGIAGVRIDRIAVRVGLSKGSFFHHFANVASYRSALLDRWRADASEQLTNAPEVSELADLVTAGDVVDVWLERAIRAWAQHDRTAAAALEEVDGERLAALRRAWESRLSDPKRARAAALLPHLVVIGATVAHPATSQDDLAAVFRLLAELIPAVDGTDHP
ncbi:TetR/AcrR family transcriptional regulator [Microbacterium hibisci]|uniref:TetR/AcrR family transcriptional regulator n=1 Tax=Microbacterium hibisci TaxID=2036000 RepID=UPI00194474A9|nr:TetR/AcrR family transcriptional regulator [Microbacterium hibisci]